MLDLDNDNIIISQNYCSLSKVKVTVNKKSCVRAINPVKMDLDDISHNCIMNLTRSHMAKVKVTV